MWNYPRNKTSKLTASEIARHAQTFQSIFDLDGLSHFFELSRYSIDYLALNPQYSVFFVPKKSGTLRRIENPSSRLKALQHRLNKWMQCLYYTHRSKAAYGFTINAKNDAKPRNIVTNARRHLGREWVLNIDLKDFFYYVHAARLRRLFEGAFFQFSPKLADRLVLLTTYNGRLPMGSPSSPVLANFACLKLDACLLDFAATQGWRYTRYADDLTFSSNALIEKTHIDTLESLIAECGFELNPDKVQLYHKCNPPLVTGLRLLPKGPDIQAWHEEDIRNSLQHIKVLLKRRAAISSHNPLYDTGFLLRSLQGKISYMGFVRGSKCKRFRKYRKKYRELRAK
jgi:RNA-directed DNA polymerase